MRCLSDVRSAVHRKSRCVQRNSVEVVLITKRGRTSWITSSISMSLPADKREKMLRTPPPHKGKEPIPGGSSNIDDQEGRIDEDVEDTNKNKSHGNDGELSDHHEDNTQQDVGSGRDDTTAELGVLGKSIWQMTAPQLRDELQRRQLSTVGLKQVLLNRLKKALEDDIENTVADETDEDNNTNDEQRPVRRTRGLERRHEQPPRNIRRQRLMRQRDPPELLRQEAQRSGGEGDRRSEASHNDVRARQRDVQSERETTHVNHMGSTFTIKDVEGSIPVFTGDDKMTIHKWIEEFEDTCVLLQWSDLQKVIYGKKMLRGSAKQFIALERGLTSWNALKSCLIREFEVEVNSATIHTQLQKRKRQTNETPRQYVYAMQTIANQGYVEDEALIQYIIDGIPDDETQKQILYNSRTIEEVKKNLELYYRMCEKSGRSKPADKSVAKAESSKDRKDTKEKKDFKQATAKKTRCFACGSLDPEVKECPHKDKGPKCFRCDQFGHISTKCENPAKTVKRPERVNRVTVDEDTVVVQMNEAELLAILDTGSSKTILRDDGYRKIGSPALNPTGRMFKGFGNVRSKATGVFTAKLTINAEVYINEVYVVPIEAMDAQMLLGKDLQKQMDIRIVGGQTTIQKLPAKLDDSSATNKVKNIGNLQRDNVKDDNIDGDTDEWVTNGLSMINYINPSEIDVHDPYDEKIRRLIEGYTPNQQVQTNVETRITLKDQEPVRAKPRRLSVQDKQVLQKQIDEWLKDGIVKPSRRTYSSAIVIVPKKDGSHRVCVDYRQLNKKIIRDQFPMPLIEDCIDALASARVFSVLDLKNGFFHVPVAEESQKYVLCDTRRSVRVRKDSIWLVQQSNDISEVRR